MLCELIRKLQSLNNIFEKNNNSFLCLFKQHLKSEQGVNVVRLMASGWEGSCSAPVSKQHRALRLTGRCCVRRNI